MGWPSGTSSAASINSWNRFSRSVFALGLLFVSASSLPLKLSSLLPAVTLEADSRSPLPALGSPSGSPEVQLFFLQISVPPALLNNEVYPVQFPNYNGKYSLPLVLAQGSPIIHSSWEGELGIALESMQDKKDLI